MIKCNLAVLMAERKLSIQDVSDETGLSRTTISALVNETGKGIQFDTLDALCELLEVTPGELFTYTSFEVSMDIIAWEKNGPQFSTIIDDNLDEVEKTFEDAFLIRVKLNIRHGFKKIDEEVNLQVNVEKNDQEEISDIYIKNLHRTVHKFFGINSLSRSQWEEIYEIFELPLERLFESEFSLKPSSDLLFHFS